MQNTDFSHYIELIAQHIIDEVERVEPTLSDDVQDKIKRAAMNVLNKELAEANRVRSLLGKPLILYGRGF